MIKAKNKVLISIAVFALTLFGLNHPSVTPEASAQDGQGQVTICHATGSATNPFVRITVSENALQAHLEHGDIVVEEGEECPTDDVNGDGVVNGDDMNGDDVNGDDIDDEDLDLGGAVEQFPVEGVQAGLGGTSDSSGTDNGSTAALASFSLLAIALIGRSLYRQKKAESKLD